MSERLTLSEELDRERMRLAACGVAASGGTVEGMDAAYDSDSLQAVLRLRAKLAARDAEWRAAVERMRREVPDTIDGVCQVCGRYSSECPCFDHNDALDALLAAMEAK